MADASSEPEAAQQQALSSSEASADSSSGAASSAAAMPAARDDLLDESDDESDDDFVQFKVIVLGDGAVGKTSLVRRFADDSFGGTYKQTIGLDFSLKRVVLPGGKEVALQLWDIGGQSIASKMLSKYVMGAHAVLLCYDITSTESFENLEDWMAVVKRAVEERKAKAAGAAVTEPRAFVIGNKTDISHMRTVKMARHTAFAKSVGGSGFLCSAKTGDQVHQTFFRIAAELAGVTLARADVQVQGKTITAHIINHARDDPAIKEPALPGEEEGSASSSSSSSSSSGRRCTVM